MPNDANSRGISAVTGFVLFLALLEVCYTNATYRGTVGSIPLAIMSAVIGLALFLKFAHAVGASYKAMDFFERILFWVPFVTVGIFAWRALDYWKDGYDGFMASLAIAGGVGAIIFGLTDGIASVVGSKYKAATDTLHEAQNRLHDAASVIAQGNNQRRPL
jgi:hypothetical protein